jgi:hypothetical protein
MISLVDYTNSAYTILYNAESSSSAYNTAGAKSFTIALAGTYRIVVASGGKRHLPNGSSGTLTTFEIVLSNLVLSNGHPLWLQTSSGAYDANHTLGASDGVTNNGASSGTLTYEVPMDAPDTVYYVCQNHSGMAGTVYTTDVAQGGVVLDNLAPALKFDVTANGTANLFEFQGSGFNSTTTNPTLYLQKGLKYEIDLFQALLTTDSTGFSVDTELTTDTPLGVDFSAYGVEASDNTGWQAYSEYTSSGYSSPNYITGFKNITLSGVTYPSVEIVTAAVSASTHQKVVRKGWAYSNEFIVDAGIILSLYINGAGGASGLYFDNEVKVLLHDFNSSTTTVMFNAASTDGYQSFTLTGGRYRIFAFTGAKKASGAPGGSQTTQIFSTSLADVKLSNGHPIWFQTSSGAYNAANVLTASDGVTNNGAENGSLIYEVPMDAPDTLYYVSENSATMTGKIYTTAPTAHVTNYTTTERNVLTAVNGDLVYNSTTHKFQGYANGTWVDLH